MLKELKKTYIWPLGPLTLIVTGLSIMGIMESFITDSKLMYFAIFTPSILACIYLTAMCFEFPLSTRLLKKKLYLGIFVISLPLILFEIIFTCFYYYLPQTQIKVGHWEGHPIWSESLAVAVIVSIMIILFTQILIATFYSLIIVVPLVSFIKPDVLLRQSTFMRIKNIGVRTSLIRYLMVGLSLVVIGTILRVTFSAFKEKYPLGDHLLVFLSDLLAGHFDWMRLGLLIGWGLTAIGFACFFVVIIMFIKQVIKQR